MTNKNNFAYEIRFLDDKVVQIYDIAAKRQQQVDAAALLPTEYKEEDVIKGQLRYSKLVGSTPSSHPKDPFGQEDSGEPYQHIVVTKRSKDRKSTQRHTFFGMGGGGGGGSYYDFDDELAEEKDMHSVSQQDSSKTNQLNLSIQSPIHSPVHSPINSPIELTKDSPTHSLIESARHSLAYSSTHSSIELNRHSHVDSLINSPTKHSFDSSPIDSITESIKRSLDKSTINSSIRSTKHLSVDLPVNLPMDSSNILPQSTPISINNTNSASIRSPISSPTTDLSSHPNATSEKEESVIQLPPSAVSRSSISPYKSNRMTSNHIPEQLNYAEDEYASMTIIESNTDDSKRHIRSSFKQEKKPAPKEGCCCIIC